MQRNMFLSAVVLFSAVIGTRSNAQGKTVEELKKAGDLRGLVAKLGDHRASVRRDAAVALPGIVDKVKDPAKLNPIIGRLIDVRFRDPWKSTREYSGRALMNALNKTKDQVVLNNAIQPLLDALDKGQVDVERRRYAAVALSVVVMRLERVDLLRPRISELLVATFKDPDEGVRKYAERALQHTLMKLDHEPTLTIAAHPLAAHLDNKDLHFRSYSAVMLSMIVHKIKDHRTLNSLLSRISTAATKDPDKGVREYAGRAMRHIQSALKPKKKPAAPVKGKASTKRDNLPASVANVSTKPTEPVKQSGNWRDLVPKLKDKDPEMRRRAAMALQEVLRQVSSEADLKQVIPPLVAATLNDSSADVREPARFALRHVLSKVKDEAALIPVAQSYLAGLKRKDAKVRSHCAHDLPGVVSKISNEKALVQMLGPLTAATLKAESMNASDFPGFALRNALRKIDDPTAMTSVMQTFIDGLKHKDSTMRTFFAHGLHENVSKIKDTAVLMRMVNPLAAATVTLKVTEPSTDGAEAGELAYFALKQVLGQVDDQAALKSIILPMAEALKAKEVKRRRYAAHTVMLFGYKVKDLTALTPLIQPLVTAHFNDSDKRVRQSAEMALKKTFGQVPEPK